MYDIIFYSDRKGNKPVWDFIVQLSKANGKDSRIKLKKIQEYINVLAIHGASMGEPYMKHLDGDIWELRPINDRILFAGLVNGKYILLHHFPKKTQKTPRREIEQAKKELKDFLERSALE